MRIAIVGTGYVGLVSGAGFAEFGVEVCCVDKDIQKIENLNKGILPIYEPGLESLVLKNAKSGRLIFTTDLKKALHKADAVFIAVGTPTRQEDGHADLTYVFKAAEEIIQNLTHSSVIVTKSTVPIGTGRKILELIHKKHPGFSIEVASNPEFLREGSAIEDFMRPDRVVVGTEFDHARQVLQSLYRPFYLRETPIVFTSLETAELIKYAANGFLATKIAFINEISNLCEACNADVQTVATAIGLDNRIGSKFLHAGPGYGGSCFPKDTLALAKAAQEYLAPLSIIEAVIQSNNKRKKEMAQKIISSCDGTVKGKTLGVLGLTFKPNTDDMRDSPALTILPILHENGAKIQAYDPIGMQEAKKHLPFVSYVSDAYSVMKEADALIILTEWNEFRSLDLNKAASLLKQPLMIDLRNIYPLNEIRKTTFSYYSIGRPPIQQKPHLIQKKNPC